MSPLLRSFVFLLVLATASCQAVMVSKDELNVDVSDFELIMDTTSNGILLDVRTDNEFAQGHLRGAQQIDFYMNDFSNALEKLDKDQPVFIYCRSGNRSGKTAQQMKAMGFSEVYNLEGGISAWSKRGKPIAK
ncbi:MAG: rhodanese-like domain-containing protein [Bacteroidota bacterium]|nr:rhodanese-like domain-containing protein [Bacteroidota bacterium]